MGHPIPIFAWRSKFSDFLYKADTNAPIRTLKAQGGQYTGPFHWGNRPFSVGELKRLQTFPDAYELVGRRQIAIHQIGNSVPPQIARMLAVSILNQLFGVDLPAELPLLEQSASLGFRQRKRGLTAIYRAKAQSAIDELENKPTTKTFEGREYHATLADDFAWRTAPRHGANLCVRFTPNDSFWTFDVAPLLAATQAGFQLQVSAVTGATWAISVPKVLLHGAVLTREIFTGAWKAFEAELVRHRVKADLVQLCGYYQYKPILCCVMQLPRDGDTPWQWRALKQVVEGNGVGPIMREEELAAEWDIPVLDVPDFAQWLRSLGYEVRNRRTNPQIPEKCLLVPYVFPTLNPLSVQLRKSLAGASNGKKG
jgi:DNA (cytosine-5)-methyltransferase 1